MKLAKAFKEQLGFKEQFMIHVYDPENVDYGEQGRFLKKEVEGVLGEEPGLPLKCDDCGNAEHFHVFTARFLLDMEDNGKKIKSLTIENEGIITKPDAMIFICPRCDKVILDTVF
jgi:hypothetical protein